MKKNRNKGKKIMEIWKINSKKQQKPKNNTMKKENRRFNYIISW